MQEYRPLNIKDFRDKLDQKLSTNYNYAVNTTANKLAKRLLPKLKKDLLDQGI
jgi:hypothetical protein